MRGKKDEREKVRKEREKGEKEGRKEGRRKKDGNSEADKPRVISHSEKASQA